MSTFPHHHKGPMPWGLVLVSLMVIGGEAFLIIGSWRLSDGLNGRVIDYSNPYVHFSETTASQEITDGTIDLTLGVACFVVFTILLLTKNDFYSQSLAIELDFLFSVQIVGVLTCACW